MRLPSGVFLWLINIRPGYLIFRQGNSCTIEPYMPNRFARQFSYDQLYIGNPNADFSFSGNLFEGARAWYYSVAGGTKAIFSLPHKTPNCYTSLSFCTWYSLASKMPGFSINVSCIKSIKASYKDKLESNKRARGMEEYQAAEKEARGEAGTDREQQRPRSSLLKRVGRLCPSVPMALLLRVSLSRRRLGENRRMKLRCPR